MLEDGDRRMAMFSTPNKLESQDWVRAAGGVSKVQKAIAEQIKDFCYWLSTEGPEIQSAEYVQPPESEFKHKIIADSMYAAAKIAYAIKHGMWQYLIDLADMHQLDDLPGAIAAQQLRTADLEGLYDALTDFKGHFKTVIKELQNFNIPLRRTTHNHTPTYIIDVEIPEFIGD
jgi:hypothetical protein